MSLPSYVHGASPVALLGETIGSNLRRTVDRCGDREALVAPTQDYRATYRQLWHATTRLAKALMARGVERGDRVGVWSPNRFEWVVIQYATARIGAILVNVNPAYKAQELRHALNQSGLTLLLLSRGFRQTDYTEILHRVRPECSALQHAVVLDDEWTALLEEGASVDDYELLAREASLTFDDPINIQYTSGTTGTPKGATLSHHNILNNGFFCGEVLRYTETDRVCVPVPFYHCFGMVIGNLACTSHGACIVVPGEAFHPGRTLATIEAERCTSLYGVPTMFIAQLDHPDFERTDFSSLRTGVMAGSPCPVEVMKQVRERMHIPEITICYGMTETSPVSTQTRVDDPVEKRVATVGPVHPHVEVSIVDPESGRLMARGESGELCTRGYSVMLGYWDDETATTAAIDRGRWMHTGDLASMDDDGYVSIVGRIKDMIIRGGDNVYPREVEEFLYTHPEVADAQVIGVPSARYGEEVMAWVKPKPNATLDTGRLTAFCRGAIATYKIPRYWKIVDTFPMTVTGKIQKYRMREIATRELENVRRQEAGERRQEET
ncbi:MAG: AMP-binding protein [Acidobacteria bacterium]|jgi:fatty-acyl-CoA synthase|nr:AMP-binding protein [Acidobacteriota bacterium]HJN44041.1 AMP-binding protein [Vicinamibacterales bacterium]|tara:strand:- start:71 stop:1726 length:1656 start_codon:yes stop_codon:yes gene_type:complete